MTHRANAQRLANIWLHDLRIGRETANFTLRPGLAPLEPGDLVRISISKFRRTDRHGKNR